MIPTSLGIKAMGFYGLCWFAYTATPYTNLFFFLILFQSLLLLLGLLLPWRFLAGVEVRFPSEVWGFAGEPLRLDLQWKASNKARAIDLWGLDIPGTPRGKKRLASLGRGGESLARSHASLPAQARGVLAMSRFRLRTSYPLGLFRAHKTFVQELSLWILPKPLPHEHRTKPRDSRQAGENEKESLLSPQGEEMAGVREFRPGDDPTRVYWKKSAQRGVLVLREELEPPLQKEEMFVLDENQQGEAFERQLEALAFLGQKQRRAGGELTLLCQDGEIRFGKQAKSWKDLDSFLVHAKPLGGSHGE